MSTHEEIAGTVVETIDHLDQYLGVLLEYYLVREETRGQGPLGRAKMRYWVRVVRAFETGFPEDVRRRVRYRLGKAEERGFQPIQLAMVRYSWTAVLSQWETPREARERWNRYLAEPEDAGTLVSFQSFESRRRFRTLFAEIEQCGLWPVSAGRMDQGGR